MNGQYLQVLSDRHNFQFVGLRGGRNSKRCSRVTSHPEVSLPPGALPEAPREFSAGRLWKVICAVSGAAPIEGPHYHSQASAPPRGLQLF
jgi:hypothetical protein